MTSETNKDQIIGIYFCEKPQSNGTTSENHSIENNEKILVQLEKKSFKIEPSLFQPISSFEKVKKLIALVSQLMLLDREFVTQTVELVLFSV